MIKDFNIDVSDLDSTQIFLTRMGKGITKVFKQSLVDEMEHMRDTAKRLLEEASEARTEKKYWTGLLQSAIKADIVEDRVGLFKGVVLVDPAVNYAIPVEEGHEVGFGEWWEGYHYMENAYLQTADAMVRRIENKLSEVIEAKTSYGKGLRNLATGQYAKGPAVKIN